MAAHKKELLHLRATFVLSLLVIGLHAQNVAAQVVGHQLRCMSDHVEERVKALQVQ